MTLPTPLRTAARGPVADTQRTTAAQDRSHAADHDWTARFLRLLQSAKGHRRRHQAALDRGDAVDAALHLGRWQGIAEVLRLEIEGLNAEGQHD